MMIRNEIITMMICMMTVLISNADNSRAVNRPINVHHLIHKSPFKRRLVRLVGLPVDGLRQVRRYPSLVKVCGIGAF